MNWYIASLLSWRTATSDTQHSAQQCQYLVEAGNHDEAYERAVDLGRRSDTRVGEFIGIMDLLLIYDPPADGTELLWSESEDAASEVESRLLRKDDMKAFREGPSSTGWYICTVVLCEVHDEGSHGNLSLVWNNSYLIRAASAEEAYEKAVRIGAQQQDEPGSHRCDGEMAHWEFRGIHDIVPLREVPAPGALLWCNELRASNRAVPEKSELSVFKWQAEQLQRRS